MDLWHGTLARFVGASGSGAIGAEMAGRFVAAHGRGPSPAELRSWQNSLAALGEALGGVASLDVGVRVGARAAERGAFSGPLAGGMVAAESPGACVAVATEYHLPLSGLRIDAMLFGSDTKGYARSIVLELKQWSSAELKDEFATTILQDDIEHPHPSQQALDYADWLRSYHSAFVAGDVIAASAAYCHNMDEEPGRALRDTRFSALLGASPLFLRGNDREFSAHVQRGVGGGRGVEVMDKVIGGEFSPGPGVLARLEDVLQRDGQWHLLDAQRVAHHAVLSEVRRAQARRRPSAILIRGAPGTGKTVIAVQLLADALRLGWKAAHATGGKAFTTALRSKFAGADGLFKWNMNMRNAPTQGLDLLLVDEAHRIRRTSDIQWTPTAERGKKAQVDELLDAAKVTVFFLDENQYVRPDEVGRTELIREAVRLRPRPLAVYDLRAQFRCGGSEEYLAWVDTLLGYRDGPAGDWGTGYRFRLVDRPEELDALMGDAAAAGERARLVAGFCWKWSPARPDGSLVPDVHIGTWMRPWNRKRDPKKSYTPRNDPYTLWADTPEGRDQVGCIYSAQGFEFDRVGVIWGPDLVWRDGRWLAHTSATRDRPVSAAGDAALPLLRNAYRVLLTRGVSETVLLCIDAETRVKVESELKAARMLSSQP